MTWYCHCDIKYVCDQYPISLIRLTSPQIYCELRLFICADIPFKTNTIPKTDIKKAEREIPQIRHDSAVASALNGDQPCPLESTTLINDNDNLDFHSMRENLQNSSSPIKKFDLIQSLVLVILVNTIP